MTASDAREAVDAATLLLDLRLTNAWENVEVIRASFERCAREVGAKREASRALSIVAAELAENAVKYGYWEGRRDTFRIQLWSGPAGRAEVTVESPVGRGQGFPLPLREALLYLEEAESPRAAFEGRIRALADEEPDSDAPPTSGLGLLRIAHQEGCRLEAELDGEVLRIRAEMQGALAGVSGG
ncbi:MAG: ATP-binding protein [Myxococcota bacterium]